MVNRRIPNVHAPDHHRHYSTIGPCHDTDASKPSPSGTEPFPTPWTWSAGLSDWRSTRWHSCWTTAGRAIGEAQPEWSSVADRCPMMGGPVLPERSRPACRAAATTRTVTAPVPSLVDWISLVEY